MNILTTDKIKKSLIENLKSNTIKNKILILSKDPTEEVISYKRAIVKRCKDFAIDYIEKEFKDESQDEILSFINAYPKDYGFIVLSPFGNDELTYLKKNIELKDLDAFTYKSKGLAMKGDKAYLPATARAVTLFLEDRFEDLTGKNIVLANNTEIIGKPLALYLITKRATLTVINSSTQNRKEIIKNADIFISAIGKAKYFDRSYFRENITLIDVGTSVLDGKIYGDIDYDSLDGMDIDVLTNKKGIGAITTLSLLESLL